MLQFIWKQKPTTPVAFGLVNRSTRVKLAEQIDKTEMPALRIDCGTEDFLIEDNRASHAHLVHENIRHEYEEFPGAHDWAYWDRHIGEAIAFHRRQLGI